jgi:very-short-patch-repair endonuclease
MSYKLYLHPTVSKAEIQVFEALSKAGLTRTILTQRTIVLKKTVPDFMWLNQRKIVFLDGDQVHKEGDENDAEIDSLLERQGWNILRIRYHAPLSQFRLKEIVTEIREFLNLS